MRPCAGVLCAAALVAISSILPAKLAALEIGPRPNPDKFPRAKLDSRMDYQLDEEHPVPEILDFLRDATGSRVDLDDKGVFSADVFRARLYRLDLGEITFRGALDFIGADLGLTWTYDDYTFSFTSPETELASVTVVRIYDVADLGLPLRNDGKFVSMPLAEAMDDVVRSSPHNHTSDFAVRPFRDKLLVRASWRAHEELQQLFEAIRALRKKTANGDPAEIIRIRDPADAGVFELLEKRVSFTCRENDLPEVVRQLAKEHNLPLWVHPHTRQQWTSEDVYQCTLQAREVPLGTLLDLMLGNYSLTWCVAHGRFVVGRPEDLDQWSTLAIVPLPESIIQSPSSVSEPLRNLAYSFAQEYRIEENEYDCIVICGDLLVTRKNRWQLKHALPVIEVLKQVDLISKDESRERSKSISLQPKDVSRQRTQAALTEKISFDFEGKPMIECLLSLVEEVDVPVYIDRRHVEGEGVDFDERFTITGKDRTLPQVLDLFLHGTDAEWCVDDGVVVITSWERCDDARRRDTLDPRYYLIGDLAGGDEGEEREEGAKDRDTVRLHPRVLEDLIATTVAASTWNRVGGPGMVQAIGDGLIVVNEGFVHEEVEDLLDVVREMKRMRDAWDGKSLIESSVEFRKDDRPKDPILAGLEKLVSVEFEETTLKKVAERLGQLGGFEVQIDVRALDDVGIHPDMPITKRLSGISLRSVLRITLRELDLTYVIRDGVLLITTPEEAQCQLVTKFYPIFDFPKRESIQGFGCAVRAQGPPDHDWIVELITSTVEPATWNEVGGPGSIEVLADLGCIVVSQEYGLHEDVAGLLHFLREYERRRRAGDTRPVRVYRSQRELEEAERFEKLLNTNTGPLKFAEAPLCDIVQLLTDKLDYQFLIDIRALDDVGIDSDVPITFETKGDELRSVLPRMLRQFDLTYTYRDEVLLITTPEEHSSRLDIWLYPTFDLHNDELADEMLIELITSTIEPTTWTDVGGPGAAESLGKGLVVSQTPHVHEALAYLLDAVRQLKNLKDDWDGKSDPPTCVRLDCVDLESVTLRKALDQTVSVEFNEVPLNQFAKEIGNLLGIDVDIDERSLSDVGIDVDTPVSIKLHNAPLRSAIDLTLRQLDLQRYFRDGCLLITTPEEAQCALTTRAFPVFDLPRLKPNEYRPATLPGKKPCTVTSCVPVVGGMFQIGSQPGRFDRPLAPIDGGVSGEEPDRPPTHEWLIELMRANVQPTTWSSVGGPGSAEELLGCDCLIVSHDDSALEEIKMLIKGIRDLRRRDKAGDMRTLRVYESELDQQRYARMEKALASKAGTLDFEETPLDEVVEQLGKQFEAPIHIDRRAVDDAFYVESNTPVTYKTEGDDVSLRQALDAILQPLDLHTAWRHGVLLVSTNEEIECRIVTKIHPIRDLVAGDEAMSKHELGQNTEELVEAVKGALPNDVSEGYPGGPGAITAIHSPPALIVSHTDDVQETVEHALILLRPEEMWWKMYGPKAEK
jgi:hypothetical protein